jgi:hypothetical protein
MPMRVAGKVKDQGRTTVTYIDSRGRSRNATVLGRPATAPTIGTTTTSTTGGTLNTGLSHNYKVTAMVGGTESLPSVVSNTVVTGAGTTNSNTVNWTPVAGATGYRVYGRTTSNWLLIATVSGQATATYVDTGAITPAGLPPSANDLTLRIGDAHVIVNNVALATSLAQTGVYRYR